MQVKNIIITGASGLVATQLTLDLLYKTPHCLFLISTNPTALEGRYVGFANRIKCYTLESFSDYAKTSGKSFDACVNAGFARSSLGRLLVDSLEFTYRLVTLVKELEVNKFVNISSQSIYGKETEPLWTEDAPLAPDYMYALGKYNTELITRIILSKSVVNWTNIRLSSVCENARFMNVFVKNALSSTPIHITAGNQGCSFIDVRDVASALTKVLESDINHFDEAYNLGTAEMFTIREIAEKVKRIGDEKYGTSVVITEEANENNVKIGMDNTLFKQTFGWQPQYSMDDMIISLFEMETNDNGGGIRKPLK